LIHARSNSEPEFVEVIAVTKRLTNKTAAMVCFADMLSVSPPGKDGPSPDTKEDEPSHACVLDVGLDFLWVMCCFGRGCGADGDERPCARTMTAFE
jgi:hypothetical protein